MPKAIGLSEIERMQSWYYFQTSQQRCMKSWLWNMIGVNKEWQQ